VLEWAIPQDEDDRCSKTGNGMALRPRTRPRQLEDDSDQRDDVDE
jgi:hypothetical protein